VPAYTQHAVAELVFALTLALIRHVPRAYQRTRDENFSVEGVVGTQLNGRTFGIVGLGKIGRVVAGIANGSGCKVIACDPHANPQRAPRPLVPLDELLAESHVVSLYYRLNVFPIYIPPLASKANIPAGSLWPRSVFPM
jgi:D-lactate dehydrogenase